MQRYFQFDEYNEVFSLFETIMNSGVKPSIDAWNIVIKAMTNPSRIASFGGKAKQQELVQNFERTLQTIVSSEYNLMVKLLVPSSVGMPILDDSTKLKSILINTPKVSRTTEL